jgi:hypothetical protein
LFVVDTATGQSRIPLGKYEGPAWSPDGKRIGAIADGGLAILDVAARKEVARVGWPKSDAPPEDLVWSPDQKYVLAGMYGEHGGAGDPQRFLLNLAAKTWTPSVTGQDAIWLACGETLLYRKPIQTTELAPGSGHSVWDHDAGGLRAGDTQGHGTQHRFGAERLSVGLRSLMH